MTNMITPAAYSTDDKIEIGAGQMLVKCLYREKGGIRKRPNSCYVVPCITAETVRERYDDLEPFIVSLINRELDQKVREYHASGGNGFGEQFTSVDQLMQYMDRKGLGVQLTEETIAEWFTSSGLALALADMYLEKLGDSDKAEQIVQFVRSKLVALADTRVVWTPTEVEKLLPLVELVADTPIGDKLLARVSGMHIGGNDMLSAL